MPLTRKALRDKARREAIRAGTWHFPRGGSPGRTRPSEPAPAPLASDAPASDAPASKPQKPRRASKRRTSKRRMTAMRETHGSLQSAPSAPYTPRNAIERLLWKIGVQIIRR